MNLNKYIRELKRRNVFKVAIPYGITLQCKKMPYCNR